MRGKKGRCGKHDGLLSQEMGPRCEACFYVTNKVIIRLTVAGHFVPRRSTLRTFYVGSGDLSIFVVKDL